MAKPKVLCKDLGTISFKEAWDYQSSLQQEVISHKRSGSTGHNNYLLFCEHNPVYTLGKSGSQENLLIDIETTDGFEFFKINRGGDITYHGPGQLTVYPIFDLDQFFTDVHKYVRYLEEAAIRTLADFGVDGERITDFTGVWIDDKNNPIKRKICAIGVHLSRWVSMHGLALNVNTDLSHFAHIVPCGIDEEFKTVTSMQKELGQTVEFDQIKDVVKDKFAELFECEISY